MEQITMKPHIAPTITRKSRRGLKVALISLMMTAMLFAFALSVQAHVVVYPREAMQGSYEKFSVRVPSESESPTIKVEVKFPQDVSISRFEPKFGWQYEVVRGAGDAIEGVIWTATEGGLAATEFTEFNMSGKVSDEAQSITWKAYQTYEDGEVVEWTGAPDAATPASITKVNPKSASAGTDSHGHAVEGDHSSESTAAQSGILGDNNTALWIAVFAVIVSVMACILALRKKTA